jgi:AcrR family transcriptional regulator
MPAMKEDRRAQLIEAGLAILREEGLAGFTQARIAARVDLKQGHLTYYFPTRTDILVAVARSAIETQLTGLEKMIGDASSIDKAVVAIAAATVRHENTRVLVAMNQASDQEPEVRALFNEMTDAFVARLGGLLARFGLSASQDRVDLLHALFVGLSVIDLATSRAKGKSRNSAVLTTAFGLLAATKGQ